MSTTTSEDSPTTTSSEPTEDTSSVELESDEEDEEEDTGADDEREDGSGENGDGSLINKDLIIFVDNDVNCSYPVEHKCVISSLNDSRSVLKRTKSNRRSHEVTISSASSSSSTPPRKRRKQTISLLSDSAKQSLMAWIARKTKYIELKNRILSIELKRKKLDFQIRKFNQLMELRAEYPHMTKKDMLQFYSGFSDIIDVVWELPINGR